MSKQMSIDDLIPDTLKQQVRRFIDDEYSARHHDGDLASIRTRYEAYGKMTEGIVNADAAIAAIKAGMRDCTKSLTAMDTTYKNAAEAVYAALLESVMALSEACVQTLSCVYQLDDIIAAEPMPLVEMASLDDEGSENTDALEELIDE